MDKIILPGLFGFSFFSFNRISNPRVMSSSVLSLMAAALSCEIFWPQPWGILIAFSVIAIQVVSGWVMDLFFIAIELFKGFVRIYPVGYDNTFCNRTCSAIRGNHIA